MQVSAASSDLGASPSSSPAASGTGAVWQRAAPLITGVGLGAAAVYTAVNDPSAKGTHFPGCAFHALTGLWCPGCGLTRGMHQLLTGHPFAALGYNLFVPLALIGIVFAWWNWTRTAWGHRTLVYPSWVRQGISTVLPALLIVYGVLRNIPAAPFRSLAP